MHAAIYGKIFCFLSWHQITDMITYENFHLLRCLFLDRGGRNLASFAKLLLPRVISWVHPPSLRWIFCHDTRELRDAHQKAYPIIDDVPDDPESLLNTLRNHTKGRIISRGYKRFFRRVALETCDYLKDDCLSMHYSIPIPPSEMGQGLKHLLESEVGCDIVFKVGDETLTN